MSKFEIPVTAVGAPVDLIAEKIVQSILQIVQNEERKPSLEVIDIELVDRGSCSPPS
jgi:DNA-binding LacI/PurR family transcriptional regulator